jgi:hypothetical protein
VTTVLKQSSRWRVVYDDHTAILFERLTGGQQAAEAQIQGTTNSAVNNGGPSAIARSQTIKPVVYGPQSYARRN